MGLFDNALQGSVPGGNLAAPIAVAAGALLLGKFLSSGSSASAPASGSTPAAPTSAAPSGGLLGGLSDLVQKFQAAGHGDVVNSWVGSGPNQPVQPSQVGAALGQQTISDLARRAGLNEQDLLNQLAQTLPGLVDRLSPNGRLPTAAELAAQGH
ncbi:MAG TPA: YidB family protein [Roseiarcus sp.]|nr:YidB family protein [Roseiarcus sp.]